MELYLFERAILWNIKIEIFSIASHFGSSTIFNISYAYFKRTRYSRKLKDLVLLDFLNSTTELFQTMFDEVVQTLPSGNHCLSEENSVFFGQSDIDLRSGRVQTTFEI